MLGLYLRFHARFIHATFIGVMLNFWKVGVAPTTPLYTKTPPLNKSPDFADAGIDIQRCKKSPFFYPYCYPIRYLLHGDR